MGLELKKFTNCCAYEIDVNLGRIKVVEYYCAYEINADLWRIEVVG